STMDDQQHRRRRVTARANEKSHPVQIDNLLPHTSHCAILPLDSATVSSRETTNTRPCAHCGQPVAQRDGAGRPLRYCRSNDEACLRAARNARMRQRNAPGLSGQLAQAFDLADRLDRSVQTLSDSLHDRLSPVGVERQMAETRAEAAAEVAAAHAERDE